MHESIPVVGQPKKVMKVCGLILFIVIMVIGLYWVKWDPYYYKALSAASKHTLGKSIISGHAQVAGHPSIQVAWSYAVAYFNAIWKALIVGVVVGSLIQSLIPRDWFQKAFGKHSFGSTALAGAMGLPSMMCTCCASPIVISMKKNHSSTGAAVAYWMSNTALNPAVIIFMCFVLSWKFVVLRLILGFILVFLISHLANRFDKSGFVDSDKVNHLVSQIPEQHGGFWKRWGKNLTSLVIGIVPAYVISVLILGGVRAWFFPAISPAYANSILVIVFLAIAGTLFVIPTAGEIPVVQTLQQFGLGNGPLATLMFTLPVISLPSTLMVSRALHWKVLGFLLASVVILGVIAGLVGLSF